MRLVQVNHPNFRFKLILTGLKIAGRAHIKQMLSNLLRSSEFSSIIGGYDLANEEDFSSPLLEFTQDILQSMKDHKFPCILTSGMTHDRSNENLYDAIVLNS